MAQRSTVTRVALTGGFLKCYAGALMNAALAFIVVRPGVSSEDAAFFVSAGVASHFMFLFIAGFLADLIGRRRTAIVSAILPILSIIVLCVFANEMSGLIVGNILKGAYFGLISSLMPVVVAENSPSGQRGGGSVRLQLSMQLGSIFGALCGTIVAWLQGVFGGFAWRLDFLLAFFPALLFLMRALRLPELPNPSRLRGDRSNAVNTWRTAFKPLLIVSVFMMLMSLCGMGSIGGFAVVLMGKVGFGQVPSNLIVTIIGALTILPTLFARTLIDNAGRRVLMKIGTVGIFLGMAGCGIAFALLDKGLLTSSSSRILFSLCYLIASLSFTFGPASCAWAIVPEMLPGWFRAKGTSIALLCNHGGTFVIMTFFLPLAERFGYACCFAFFAVMSFAYVLMVGFVLPETKGGLLSDVKSR